MKMRQKILNRFNENSPKISKKLDNIQPVSRKVQRVYTKRCKFAIHSCCGKPCLCAKDGQDCVNIYNEECWKNNSQSM